MTSKRVACITGGARGIGFGVAQALAAEGFDLVLAGVREEAAASAALEQLRGLGARVVYCQADVSDTAARIRLVDAVRAAFGRLHVLVNNAGVAPAVRADILEATEESFERLMRINLQGPYFLTQLAARWMIEQHKADPAYAGVIVNVSSISATVASTSRGEYCISKAGVSMATQLWAARLGEFGIPVYEVRPGIIKTDMTSAVTAKYDKLIADGLLVQPRWGLPGDVGKAVAMLARGDLPYSTGQVLAVDGGLTLERL
jgi:NAD(P)-dependent dehydrogenase (short-subunit alcohol dehydrogenase family)